MNISYVGANQHSGGSSFLPLTFRLEVFPEILTSQNPEEAVPRRKYLVIHGNIALYRDFTKCPL